MNQLPNLLIVDDTEANLVLLETVTKKIKVNLITAISGIEALEKTQGVDLALAIIDVRMPFMDGLELARKLNEIRTDSKVPIIFLAANYDRDATEGYDSGAVDYIQKPFNSRILISKIKVFLDLFNQKQTIIRNAELLKKSSDNLIKVNEALKKREEKIQEEQLFTQALLESIPGIFYLYTYPEMRMVSWNKQHEILFGFDAAEMKGRYALDWHVPEKREELINVIHTFMDTGQPSVETRLLAKDGHSIPFILTAVIFKRKGQDYLIGVGTEITERIKAEEELKNSLEQLHQLSQHVEQVREDERVAISRELHDDLGQALTAVKIDLGMIRQKVSNDEVVSKIIKVTALVGDTIKTVQRLTSQLRPDIIDDLGIEAAIEWYTKEFSQRHGVKVLLHMDAGLTIAPDASLSLFRIIQGSLTNVARHSKATEVEICISKKGESIHFRISDNGIGITKEEIKSKKSFGIMIMKERAASLGGTFEINRGENFGSKIMITFPIKNS